MSIESPKTAEEIKGINKEREKYDKLGKFDKIDNPNEDFLYNLAKEEDAWRGKLRETEIRAEEAEQKLGVDSLTKLENRFGANKKISELLVLEGRRGEECSILIIDIDSFKEVNDTLGHLEGDNALKGIADAIKESIRESDVAGRYGGDEFVVFLPNAEVDKASDTAERIMDNIRKLSLTVSIGISSTSQVDSWKKLTDLGKGKKVNLKKIALNEVLISLVARADDALYKSKKSGKDKATVYEKKLEKQ